MIVKYRFRMGLSTVVDGRHTMEFVNTPDFNKDFYLQDFGTTPNFAYPIYGNDLAKRYEPESDSYRFREKLSGRLRFVAQDFDLINAMALDDIMLLDIDMSWDGGESWALYHRGFFAKTDCEFDFDNKSVEVDVDSLDEYTNILNGIGKEYDLVKLAPETHQLSFGKRPLLQIYALGDIVVSCFHGASSWEVDAVVMPNTDRGVRDYGFTLASRQRAVLVKGISYEADGIYFGSVFNLGENIYSTLKGTFIKKGDSEYYMEYTYEHIKGYFFPNITIYRGSEVVANYTSIGTGYSSELDTFAIGSGQGSVVKRDFYSRVLTDVEEVNGASTIEIPTEDIVQNSGYTRIYSWASESSAIYASPQFSDEPTEWGNSIDGDYFAAPANLGAVQPLARSLWQWTSFWLVIPQIYDWDNIQAAASKPYLLRHSYPLYSVIQRLLAEVAPDITFEPTAECSEFLYGNGGGVRTEDWQLYITPKTNIVNGDYQSPAQQAIITLQEVFEMLHNVYQLNWIVEEGKLKIEHIQFFRRGASYTLDNSVAVDLTTAINPRTGKNWAVGQNRMTYDKLQLPERYEFSWMDAVTDVFTGEPIEILSPSVDRGNITKVAVAKFTSDLDYVLQNPTAISSDGFMLLAATTKAFINEPREISSEEDLVEIESKAYARYATMEISSTMTSNCRIVVYEGDNVVWQSGYFRPSTTSTLSVYIPVGATAVGFESIATVSPPRITINAFVPSNEAQVAMLKMGDYTYQNGYASFRYVLPRYWSYDLPSRRVRINGEEMTLGQSKKAARQMVVFPSATDIDPLKLIRTNIGDGQVMGVSITISSRRTEVTLAYER